MSGTSQLNTTQLNTSRLKLVAGNWKMNTTRAGAVDLARAIAAEVPADRKDVEVLVCPPFPYLLPVGEAIRGSGVKLGAQNCCFEPPGAFTGEIAVPMLVDTGCRYVILGHSERRHVFGETDEVIGRKVAAAIAGGLEVILCVGELLAEREGDKTGTVLDRHMDGGLSRIKEEDLDHVVVAYEPVWAIGTGKTASPAQAEEAHLHLRKWLATRYNSRRSEGLRILYGGSVKADNALELMSQADVDGALVGGASLKADSFLAIVEAAAKV
ncbi:MAG TPA: triose-phosphate isomerase, partial [Planctomycetaceae bacterium]|nr:triose-phosphate isomerase [Planctomycetaceae bacterium]